MKYGVFVEITGGKSHFDLSEDRCENLEDCRTQWNVSFQLDGQAEPYCIAFSIVTRLKPERKIFLPAVVASIRRQQGVKNLGAQMEADEWTPDCTIWRLGGRPQLWPSKLDDDTTVLVEYDAIEQHGYALITSSRRSILQLRRLFPHAISSFRITKEEEELLIEKW